ncbi:acyl-ACP--UDP-N-acetylglucosamine O-acyltransferase [Haloferula chungangensis]|uniref:Acyl-[acyl-carrier-protein]--UDP-N-acetylglucosamine O-acyltransferase n=1 Tax=Haloferula chungangensis TaxID=1048331 RepID=A0ABW2LCH2_9BACT
MIHPTAIVSPKAKLGNNVRIGPYSVVGDDVELGDGCILHSHVIVEGPSTFGRQNEFFPFAAVGGRTQDLKYTGEPTYLEVGDRNTFRENCTIHRGTHAHTPTRIGSDNLFLCYSHVAHDCQVGSHVILSNNATIAGHVTVEDYAIISGLSAVHQFARVGCHSIIGGMARISQDVAPYTIAEGHDPRTRGLNHIGLQRRGFSEEDIRALKGAYKKLFLKKDTNLSVSLSSLKAETPSNNPHVKHLIAFLESTQRGVTR